MTDTAAYPYATHLNIKFPQLATVDVPSLVVSGVAYIEMKDGKPLTLRTGGFAMMPSKHVHQFHCASACALYIYSDAAFDMHYVDAQGKEMTPEDALKAVKESAPKETK